MKGNIVVVDITPVEGVTGRPGLRTQVHIRNIGSVEPKVGGMCQYKPSPTLGSREQKPDLEGLRGEGRLFTNV